ncbi:MAG TPA: CoA ester lyase [Acidimicrobiales bacterium]|nr:CoA ester lyase [Acidimicrobiales bacterium]
MNAHRSLRAMLFVPGNSATKLAKLATLAAHSFIVDLEDSVPPNEKERARAMVADLVRHSRDEELYVRINDVASPYATDDLAAVLDEHLAGVVVPKAESPDDLVRVNELIDALAHERGLDATRVGVIATIETAAGLHRVEAIAGVGGHLRRLGFGAGDFALDLGLDWPDEEGTPEIMLWAKSQLAIASRLAGLAPPHDGAFTNYRDLEGLAREARQSRRLGFGGKHVIHPSQVAVVEDVFRPSERQIERARRLIEAFEEAERSGSGALGLDGELIDYAIVNRARRLLEEQD